jgi:hypothetical protein
MKAQSIPEWLDRYDQNTGDLMLYADDVEYNPLSELLTDHDAILLARMGKTGHVPRHWYPQVMGVNGDSSKLE